MIKGENVDALNPSEPSEILGLNDVPQAGDDIIVVENESRAREVSEYRKALIQKRKQQFYQELTPWRIF